MHEVAAQASADSDQGDKERKQQLQRGYEELRWSSACREAYVSHITVSTGVACNDESRTDSEGWKYSGDSLELILRC